MKYKYQVLAIIFMLFSPSSLQYQVAATETAKTAEAIAIAKTAEAVAIAEAAETAGIDETTETATLAETVQKSLPTQTSKTRINISKQNRPPLPSGQSPYSQDQDQEQESSIFLKKSATQEHQQTAIVLLDKPATNNEIQKIIKPYRDLQLRYTYQHVFNGFSVTGPEEQINALKKTQTIQAVYPSHTYKLNFSRYPSIYTNKLTDSINYIGTNNVRHILDAKGNHLTGKGVKVGIIDTGIDYTHPDLRSAYKKGYDFVDNDNDPMETKNAGPYNTFHGTHVAGVIAAKGRMTGVAPDAEIYAYRALGPGGFGSTEQIIAAIDQAIKDKVDVLNLSLGISINGPDLPTSLALDKAVKNGIVAVTSNGNTGPNLWTVGSPGTSHRAISVGASTPKLMVPYLDYFQHQFRLTPLYGSAKWVTNGSLFLVDGKLGKSEELQDVKGKIVLIKRGILTFTEKVENAVRAGAKAVIIYNNVDGELLAELEKESPIPVAAITKQDGSRLLKLIKKNKTPAKVVFKKEEDLMASFSSRGPVTFTWDIKPDIVAPGVAITSTVPGGYMPLQGTSMASPHVAGASALLKQAHPNWTPGQIKSVLLNTSKPLTNESQIYYQTFEQGAGRIQLEHALNANSIVKPGTLLYGRTKGQMFDKRKQTLEIENISDQTVRYTFNTPKHSELINWDFPEPFYLKPKEKKRIVIIMEVKSNHPGNEIFNGYVEMQANSQTIAIPYLYVVKEPNYPRIMAFSFGEADRPGVYKYDVYLPGGADEFGILLYDYDTHQYIDYLDWDKNVRRGLVTKEIKADGKVPPGSYIAIAFAKKAGQENYLEQIIEIR